MKAIIVGYGRMGRELANNLLDKGNEVVVIDASSEVIAKIAERENLSVIVGMGIDREVLEKAGIERADAVVACTNTDESNAVIARIARNYFRVPQVIARLYDPDKAAIYDMLGVQTISTTDWGIKRAMKLLEYTHMDSVFSIGNSDIEIIKANVPALLVGKTVQTISAASIHVIGLVRGNKSFIPMTGTRFEKNDIIYVAVENQDITKFRSMLGK